MTPHRMLLAASAALIICLFGSSAAEAKTETLRAFSKVQTFTITSADGTVSDHPTGPPKPGDVMEINSLDFKGNHKKHAKKAFGSDYLRCTFGTDPNNPDCFGYTAIRGSILRFHGFEIIGGTGRYLGASGKVVKSKEVKGGSDFVVRIKRP